MTESGTDLQAELNPGAGPKYSQIYEYLREQIEREKLRDGEYLPPEGQLARDFAVSVGTIKKALQRLKAENYVHRRQGDGTRVSFAAGTLRDRKTIAVVLGSITRSFYAEIYSGIQKELDERGYKPLLLDTGSSPEKERDYLTRYGKQVGGVLVAPVSGSRNHACFGQLLADEVPFVFIDWYLSGFNVDAVVSDNAEGGYLATRRLLELGHRRIAVVGATETTSLLHRIDGYRKALSEFGVALDESLLLAPETRGYEGGYQIADDLVRGSGEATAAFCLRDDTAWGCLQRLSELQVRVPEEFSVIGYDDNEDTCSRIRPRLTTVRQPKSEIGQRAAGLIVDRMESRSAGKPEIVSLPVRLVERESVGPAPSDTARKRMQRRIQRARASSPRKGTSRSIENVREGRPAKRASLTRE